MDILRRLRGRPARPDRDDPIVIGGTGGSGTRVVHGALQAAGVYVGWRLNHAGDAMDFEPVLDRHINPVLEAAGSLDYQPDALPRDVANAVRSDLRAVIRLFAGEVPARCRLWGWKNPRSMFLLPFLAEALPRMRFVHLVRDGRDMATSDNQNQLLKHGAALLGEAEAQTPPERSIALWARVNGDVADWAERTLPGRYLRVRYEDVCADPIPRAADLLRFAGMPSEEADLISPVAAFGVDSPRSLGRWRDLAEETSARLETVAGPTLTRFGYAGGTPG